MKCHQKQCEEKHQDSEKDQNPAHYSHVPKGIASISLAVFVIDMQVNLEDKLGDARRDDSENETVQSNYKQDEKRVVVSPYTCSKPDTVVVKLADTVVT